MTKKNLTKIDDLNKEDIKNILTQAFVYKKEKDECKKHEDVLQGKAIAAIFEKASLRTKVALETAAYQLGGHAVYLTSSQILESGGNQKGRESIPDIAHNLERFCDLIAARVFHHEVIDEMAKTSNKPVINLLCDKHHPTQTLADLMTVYWHTLGLDSTQKDLPKIKVAFIGDGNNVSQDLMLGCAIMGIDFAIASPKGFESDSQITKNALELAEKSGSKIEILTDSKQAVDNSDFVYTDTFVSMGEEDQYAEKIAKFANYQVNSNLLKLAKTSTKFMHCLPAHRGEEVTDEVMDSSQSIIFDQAECRLHIMKALLHYYFN